LSDILELFYKYRDICFFGEEAVLNLFFYKKWNKLSKLYNFVPWHMYHYYSIRDFNFPAPIIHWVCSEKPWEEKHPNYLEWKNNLAKADQIDLDNRLKAKKIWTKKEIKAYILKIRIKSMFLIFRIFFNYCDRQIGRFGLLIKKFSPNLYEKIKPKKENDKRYF
jgi:lipopolysaccharide biosynthesis glycosyltransferase